MTQIPTSPAPPLLPARQSAPAAPDALPALRRFHLAPPEEPAAAATGFLPAPLHASRGSQPHRYPVFLAPPGSDEVSCPSLPDLLSKAAPREAELPLADLAEKVGRLADHPAPVDARELLEKACRSLLEDADDAGPLADGLGKLTAAIPAGGSLLPASDRTPLHLLMHAARGRLLPARAAFGEKLRALAAEAETLLAADRQKRPESRSSSALDGSLGELGSRFVDPSALAGVLDARGAGTALSAERKARLEEARLALEGYRSAAPPTLIVAHDGAFDLGGEILEAGDAWRVERHDDPCAAAAAIFDREAESLAGVLRASRRIKLEAEGRYDPERQDPWLEGLDWQAFSRRELLLLTPVVALVAADRVAGPGMVSFSGLLRSGRPVQVLVPIDPAANPGSDGLGGFRFEPAYLGLSHREAYVQQTSVAEPAHMLRGFARALAATRTGLHVVSKAGGRPAGEVAVHAAAAIEARAHPLFHYDPETGPSWAERLDFSLNPQAGIDWPVHAVETRRPDDSGETLELAFTFADFALLEPGYRHHFHAVADGVPDVELVPAAEFSRQSLDDEAAAIPYVWGVDAASKLVRLAISRPLALACRDRLDFWRILQELSGVRSEHVRRARALVREELEEQAAKERAALEARHAEELERVRHDAARDVVDRLTSALLEVDVAAFTAPAPAGPLAGLAGTDVDSVAAALLQIVDVASLDDEGAEPAAEEVEKLASDLLDLVEE